MKKEKGIVGCVTCGTSLGCFFPLALLLSVVLVVAASSYFDADYYWESFDTGMVIGLAMIVIPAVVVGLIQAAIGIWSIYGFFDDKVTPAELDALVPLPYKGEGKSSALDEE
ncbi:MAG: hypothetical protein HN855_16900 [Anaerolineae bacterium]|jgi:hypothetical protein|nr:hypothetical protein [Anaerolineae bacterium]MBT7069384.1 hypothetical protein [Anaerolineae bacterium]MBT7326828.1 hypothetical protein [Anaerolineae bacterium]